MVERHRVADMAGEECRVAKLRLLGGHELSSPYAGRPATRDRAHFQIDLQRLALGQDERRVARGHHRPALIDDRRLQLVVVALVDLVQRHGQRERGRRDDPPLDRARRQQLRARRRVVELLQVDLDRVFRARRVHQPDHQRRVGAVGDLLPLGDRAAQIGILVGRWRSAAGEQRQRRRWRTVGA